MVLGAYLTGIHARSESLIQATQDYGRGRISETDLNLAFRDDIDRVVALQVENEFTYVLDGMLTYSWNDLFRPFTEKLGGVEPSSLRRWFDTNTFYRVPKIKSKPEHGGGVLEMNVGRKGPSKHKPMKVVVPGPYTFAQFSDCTEAYADPSDLMYDFAIP